METRAHYILVGSFTLLAGALAVIFALWLSDGRNGDSQRLEIVFNEAVSGLSSGSPVLFNGIRVGEVEDLTIDPDDANRVRARIRVDAQAPVTQNTRARLAITNITGASHIQLEHDDHSGRELTADSGELPVIEADPSPLARLRITSEEILLSANQLVTKANDFFDSETIDDAATIIGDLRSFMSAMSGETDSFQELLAGLNNASGEFNQTLALLNEVLTELGEEGAPLLSESRDSIQQLSQVTARLDRLLADNEQALDSGLEGVAELGPTMEQLRATVRTLHDIARQIDEDPAAYLFGREQLKEYNP